MVIGGYATECLNQGKDAEYEYQHTLKRLRDEMELARMANDLAKVKEENSKLEQEQMRGVRRRSV